MTLVSAPALAGPLFPLPNPAAHPPGFVLHLPSPGPAVLPPGAALPPLFYGDALPSPDLHHWEVEIHNPAAGPIGFNLGMSYPGGPTGMFLTLGPGESVYLDTHLLDFPPEVGGPYAITASSSAGMPGPVLIDTSVVEYPGPVGTVPGTSGMLFSAGGTSSPSVPGAPTVLLGVAIPEPASLSLLALGGIAALARRRRNR